MIKRISEYTQLFSSEIMETSVRCYLFGIKIYESTKIRK